MNYNEQETRRKKKKLVSRSSKNKRKLSVSMFKGLLVVILFFIVAGIGAGFGAIKGILDNLPDVTSDSLIPQGYQTTLYYQNGKEVTTLSTSNSNRIYANYNDIPENLRNAFIAIEDERFWTHNGIDIRGIGRAAFTVLTGGRKSGASTITQQLIKNQIFNVGLDETTFLQTVERKIQEQYLAVELEKSMKKETILEYYLNTIYLGKGAYGVQAATELYFGKEMKDLTISECAVIAAITQNPTKYDPVAFPEENVKRRKSVLDKMLALEYIDQKEYDAAIADDVYTRIKTTYETANENKDYNSYFVDAVITDLKEKLVNELEYTETQAYNAIYSGGLSIYVTQDPTIQKICDDIVNDDANYPQGTSVALEYLLSIAVKDDTAEDGMKQIHFDGNKLLNYYKEKTGNKNYNLIYSSEETATAAAEEFKQAMLDEYKGTVIAESLKTTIQPQASYVLMDQHTGEVKAIVGGRGPKTSNLSLNRATMSTRQPGSTFKVLAAFVPAMDAGGKGLGSAYKDEPYSYTNGRPVKNWYSGYRGWSSFREAITNSMNIIAVKTITDITPQVSFDYLTKMGFTTLVDSITTSSGAIVSDKNQSLALGGVTNGVYNIELTAAYASIANGGTYVEPILYTKVLDHDGNLLLDNTPEEHEVMQPTTAWMAIDAMKDVISKGTGRKAALSSRMPVAGKTGTTSSNYDYWFCGFTPYYTASVWMGYDVNTDFANKQSYHKTMWAKIMNAVIEAENQSTAVDFPKPDGLTTATVCAESGMLPIKGICPTSTDYFAKGTVPTKTCDIHKQLVICKDSLLPATDYCPDTITVTYSEDEDGRIKITSDNIDDIGLDSNQDKSFLEKKCTMHTESSEYSITCSVIGTGGSISPSTTVAIGENCVIKITPDPGYKIKQVVVDDEKKGAITKFTFKKVSKNHTITATFVEDSSYNEPDSTAPDPSTDTTVPTPDTTSPFVTQ